MRNRLTRAVLRAFIPRGNHVAIALCGLVLIAFALAPADAHDERSCCDWNCEIPGVAVCPEPYCETLHDTPQNYFDPNCRNCQCSRTICWFRSHETVQNFCYICANDDRVSCQAGTCEE
jgi:hypothetical protein